MKTLHYSIIIISVIIVLAFSFQESFAQGVDTMGNPIIPSPLKQFKSGIQAQTVQCKTGDELILKSQDGSPACVKPMTAKILIDRDGGHCPLRLGFVNCP